MSAEFLAFLAMVICGGICGVLYDFFRSIHLRLTKHNIIVMITDIVYWITVTYIIIFSLWYFNTGQIRAYAVVGTILGAILYFLTVGHIIYRCFLCAVDNFVRFMRLIFKILLTLWAFLYKIIVVPTRCFFENFRIRKRKISED